MDRAAKVNHQKYLYLYHCTILRHLAKVDLEASPGKALRRLEVGESQGGQVEKNTQKIKMNEHDIRIKGTSDENDII